MPNLFEGLAERFVQSNAPQAGAEERTAKNLEELSKAFGAESRQLGAPYRASFAQRQMQRSQETTMREYAPTSYRLALALKSGNKTWENIAKQYVKKRNKVSELKSSLDLKKEQNSAEIKNLRNEITKLRQKPIQPGDLPEGATRKEAALKIKKQILEKQKAIQAKKQDLKKTREKLREQREELKEQRKIIQNPKRLPSKSELEQIIRGGLYAEKMINVAGQNVPKKEWDEWDKETKDKFREYNNSLESETFNNKFEGKLPGYSSNLKSSTRLFLRDLGFASSAQGHKTSVPAGIMNDVFRLFHNWSEEKTINDETVQNAELKEEIKNTTKNYINNFQKQLQEKVKNIKDPTLKAMVIYRDLIGLKQLYTGENFEEFIKNKLGDKFFVEMAANVKKNDLKKPISEFYGDANTISRIFIKESFEKEEDTSLKEYTSKVMQDNEETLTNTLNNVLGKQRQEKGWLGKMLGDDYKKINFKNAEKYISEKLETWRQAGYAPNWTNYQNNKLTPKEKLFVDLFKLVNKREPNKNDLPSWPSKSAQFYQQRTPTKVKQP